MNNEIRNTKYEPRFGFTLVELVVAIGIMALVILFAGNIFKTSISSYRIASAQAEIMQKFRAITDQLNNDFRGLRKNAPMFIWFQKGPNGAGDPNRFDQIMFFADGDFQSIQTYNVSSTAPYNGYIVPQPSGSPVVSNLARIYYGQAQSIDPRYNILNYPFNLRPVDRVLSRRQNLYIANPNSGPQYWQFPLNSGVVLILDPNKNDWFEHDTNSLSQWQAAVNDPINGSTNVNNIITGCFGPDASYYSSNRPTVNITDANTLHLLMAQKVGNFSVQWSYLFTTAGQTYVYWWPSIDPAGNGNLTYSDFGSLGMSRNAFGFYFNTTNSALPAPTNLYWFLYGGAYGYYYPDLSNPRNPVNKPVFPRALKFTFTLYDSRGVFKDGQTFTHIVYLGD